MYICLNCYEVYDNHLKFNHTSEYNFCPKTSCDGDVIEVDELFIPVITELNKKGYDTTNCCSGHSYESYINSYIGFEDYVELPSLPEGYMYDRDLHPQVDWDKHDRKGMDCIRKVFDNSEDKIELSKSIYQNAINMLEWVKGLPDFNENVLEEEYDFCNYDGDISEFDCSDKECDSCEHYIGFNIVTTDKFNEYYKGYGYPEFVMEVIHNLDDRNKYGLIGEIKLIDAEISKRVYIENENGEGFIVRYNIIDQDEEKWEVSYTLYKNIKCEDGSGHGEMIDEGFAGARYVVGDGE